jgi:arylsulfatase A-like enzyme
MISRMDADIGRIIAKLKQRKIDNNTLVFFASDNGPHKEGGNDPDFNNSNGPLQGIKRRLTEGGIRIPFIARWPGKIAAGATSPWIGGFQDVMPTLAELTGTSDRLPADLDGVSFLPTLLGQDRAQRDHDYLYWAFYEGGAGQAVRFGKWKAVQQPYHSPIRLYDLSSDIGEQHDLADQHADLVQRATALMKDAYRPSDQWQFPAAGTGRQAAKKG